MLNSKALSILLLDNYDSFTYNLYHQLYTLSGVKPVVMRNTLVDASVVLDFDRLVISPGPGLPEEAGRLMEVIAFAWGRMPILGVCLGHQALSLHSGGRLVQLKEVYHGVARRAVVLEPEPMYAGLTNDFEAGSYHSWTVDADCPGEGWIVNAKDEQGQILSMRQRELPIWGVQYHPESVLSNAGDIVVKSWLSS